MADTTKRSLLAAAMAGTMLALAPHAASAQESQDYLLATASTGGTYYPVGVAIATLVKVRLQNAEGINMSAINSAGSGENIRLLRDGEADFAILQGLFGAYARQGTGPIEESGPQDNLRSITGLWPNVEHFVILSEHADTGTISDMGNVTGKAVSMGLQNSGTIGSNEVIMANLGMPLEEFELAYMGYNPSADALQNGQIVAMSTPAGVPVSAVTRAFAAMGDNATLLGFTDEQIAQANGSFEDLWTAYPIPAGTYPSQDEDVTTIAQPNFLAVDADVPEETVYLITKAIFENLPFLQAIHPATNAMNLESALPGLPLPLHPGALRYYEEAGLTIPDRLRP
ncbi:TAXI family TRAP transporter solute-binding subunit [Salinarimonas rosea]|uniref:TAXI family TRAP transporter solute-binding subunit n=1 Tax=Salinarimonas rosea TaxID=552063 RepID=UPI0003F8C169|nr:TAXI family TRAP transporter solute-binding subunit [Salinarimonas rosea]